MAAQRTRTIFAPVYERRRGHTTHHTPRRQRYGKTRVNPDNITNIINPKHITINMANNNQCTEHNNPERAPFVMTYELQVNMEDRLLQLFSAVIDLDAADREFPIWGDTTNQLMEVAWTLSKMRRIIDHDTHRPMTMHRIATLLCQNLHRRMPTNIYSVARQSRMTGRPPVVEYFARLWYEGGVDPSVFIQWQKPISFPPFRSYRGVF